MKQGNWSLSSNYAVSKGNSVKTVVIVGASHAAAEAIAALRKQGWVDHIVLIGNEPCLPYQRPPLSKAYFKGELDDEQLMLKRESFYEQQGVELKLGCFVTAIDRVNKQVSLEAGEQIEYDALIIATGTRARLLLGVDASINNVHYLRTKSDVDALKKSEKPGARMLIIGAGYIGLEIAASAIKKGMHVTVLESADRVLARVTSPEISEFYQQLHKSNGVDIRLNVLLREFIKDNGETCALLENGKKIPFDLAVVGIGVLPNTELAAEAGLACDNGIMVDQYTRTDDPNIYAIGDCSNHPNPIYDRRIRLESVPNAVDQAKVAAANICGAKQMYSSLPWFWSDQYDVKLQTAGLLQGYDQVVVRGEIESQKFSVFYLMAGRLIAMDAINSPADFMTAKKLIVGSAHPDPKQLADTDVAIKTLLNQV